MSNPSPNTWTTAQFVRMSASLASACGVSLPEPERQKKRDRWNRQRFLNLSAAKSLPFI